MSWIFIAKIAGIAFILAILNFIFDLSIRLARLEGAIKILSKGNFDEETK